MDDRERFKKFTAELAILSLKYGIVVRSAGGIAIFDEGELIAIEYSDDHTSGDLDPSFEC